MLISRDFAHTRVNDFRNAMRHVGLFRAIEGFCAGLTREGQIVSWNAELVSFGLPCEPVDLDVRRVGVERKMALSRACTLSLPRAANLLESAQLHDSNNPVTLHALKNLSDRIIGKHKDAKDALAYIRRSSVQIHPDKTADLAGWEIPGVVYMRSLGPSYKVEHAKEGAKNLFLAHQSVKRLHENPHYARALYSPAAMHGTSLTLRQLAKELSVLSVCVGILSWPLRAWAFAAAFTGCAYTVFAIAAAVKFYRSASAARRANKRRPPQFTVCRDLVPYKPSFSQRAQTQSKEK